MTEAGNRLTDEHTETVDHGMTPQTGANEKVRGERHIDDVGDDGGERQRVEGQIERGLALHAEARGIDEKTCAPKGFGPIRPRDDRGAMREVAGQPIGESVSAFRCTVDEAQFLHSGVEQRRSDGTGGTAGAEQHRRRGIGSESRTGRAEMEEEAAAIGVAAEEAAIGVDENRVDGADAGGCRIVPIDESEGRFLVREGDVEAEKAEARQQAEGSGEVSGRDPQGEVEAVDAMASEPVIVEAGREGVGDGIAEESGEACSGGEPHGSLWLLEHDHGTRVGQGTRRRVATYQARGSP